MVPIVLLLIVTIGCVNGVGKQRLKFGVAFAASGLGNIKAGWLERIANRRSTRNHNNVALPLCRPSFSYPVSWTLVLLLHHTLCSFLFFAPLFR
jgi:hypothetical protein